MAVWALYHHPMAFQEGGSLRSSRYQRVPQQQRWSTQQQPIPEPPLVPQLAEVVDWLATLPHVSLWPSLLIDRLLLAPVSTLLAMTRDVIVSPRTHRVVVRLGVLATLFWFALAAAVVSYVGFYRAWVPEPGLRKDVWLQYGHAEPPFAQLDFAGGRVDFFAQDQAYDVTLELGVPLNEANLDLGNFMVSLELQSHNRTLFHVSKPTLLRFSPASVRAIDSLSQLMSRNPPTERGPSDSQLLRIPLLKRAVLRPSSFTPPLSATPLAADRKVTHGKVQVGRHDADRYWRYGARATGGMVAYPHIVDGRTQLSLGSHSSRGELQTYSASLRFDAHLTGLRFFMYHYPLLSFFVFTSLFLAFEMATALTLWGVAAVYTSTMAVPSLDTEEHFQDEKRAGPSRVKPESDSDDSYSSGQDTETESDAQRSRRVVKEESDDDDEDSEEARRQRSLESLRARDAAEYAEAVRQSRMRDVVESRRMSGEHDPAPASPEDLAAIQLSHRVLDRLDEETEEDTEVGGSLTEDEGSLGSHTARTARYMDLNTPSEHAESAPSDSEHSSDAETPHKGDSTIGGVSTLAS